MNLQQLMSYARRAIDDYQMIDDNDVIGIGVSGGKDSVVMALVLKGLQRFYPKPFTLKAFTIDLGFDGFDPEPLTRLFRQMDIPYEIVPTDIAKIVFSEREEQNPCSLCSKMRKGALNDAAKAMGCNKIALGHHTEDVVETFYMSLLYEGRLHCFSPVTNWDRMGLVAIRPMIYTHEADIISYAKAEALPIVKNPCPADTDSKRQEMKELIKQLNKDIGDTTQRSFRAICEGLANWKKVKP